MTRPHCEISNIFVLTPLEDVVMPEPKLKDTIAEHQKKARGRASVAVITLSSSRSVDNDQSSELFAGLLQQNGHDVAVRKVIADSRNVLRPTARESVRQKNVQSSLTTGGT